MAVAIMFSGIAAVALPLSSEFGITREIDDRVMCPLPLWAVALEKVCFSAMQSIIAALLVIPMAYYVPAKPVRATWPTGFCFALVLVLASLLAGSLGLVIGSTVNPRQIGLVFSIIVVPITFLGCVYYPWAGPLEKIPWLQVRRALQSHRLHERRPARRGNSRHCAHAVVGDSGGAGLLHRRAGPLGTQRISGKSAVVQAQVGKHVAGTDFDFDALNNAICHLVSPLPAPRLT
jgi:hypothetical protein